MPPRSLDPGAAAPADLAACRALLRGGSRSFFAASFLLPGGVRDPATALYAFCRLADDAVDLDGGGDALARLRERLVRAYDGRPRDIAADRAFADVVARFAIPRALPEALLEGFEWDTAGRRYQTLSELYGYAARVAGSVGAMMALLMGARAPAVVARACELGVAMQLTNIARDVGEDARAGRLYLPRVWLNEAGIDPDAWQARPVYSAALGTVIKRLLRAADELYQRSSAGIGRLPPTCRPGIHAARLLYAEIGREVERLGLDTVSRRAVVPSRRKLSLLAQALAATLSSEHEAPVPPLAETRFLVEAVARAPARPDELAAGGPHGLPWWNLSGQMLWVIELFERLERRDQPGRTARALAVREKAW